MNTNNGWKLVPIEPTPEMVKAAFDQFEISAPGFATGNDARRAIYAAMLAAAPGPPPASAQEDAKEWGPAFDAWFAKRGVWPRVNYDEIFAAGWNARPVDAPAAGDARDFPDLNADLIEILGRPNFMCGELATLLRAGGRDIKRKSEHEQAAVIHFLLGHYLRHGSDWRETVGTALQTIAASQQQEG